MSGCNDEMKEVESVGGAYGGDYLSWKNWGNDKFGKLTKTEFAYYNAEIRRIGRRVPSDLRVLEIGFGNGGFLRFAREKGWDIVGTEVNEGLVRVAKDQGYIARKCEDVSDFEENAFDLVVAFDVMEHIRQDDLHRFIFEINRILRKDGHFIARFPNGDSPFGLPYQNGDMTHVTVIGSGKVSFLAERLNMDLVFLGGEAQPIVGTRLVHFVHRIVAVPIKRVMNFLVRNIFFPKSNIDFCAANLTLIYKTRKGLGS
jgi:SAM-dependent methyltransferase